jgi:glucose-6-phosphate isomerase
LFTVFPSSKSSNMQKAPGMGVGVRVKVAVGGRVSVMVAVGPTAPMLPTKVVMLCAVRV